MSTNLLFIGLSLCVSQVSLPGPKTRLADRLALRLCPDRAGRGTTRQNAVDLFLRCRRSLQLALVDLGLCAKLQDYVCLQAPCMLSLYRTAKKRFCWSTRCSGKCWANRASPLSIIATGISPEYGKVVRHVSHLTGSF